MLENTSSISRAAPTGHLEGLTLSNKNEGERRINEPKSCICRCSTAYATHMTTTSNAKALTVIRVC